MEHFVITIDGPSASGKSTCAKLLAEQLGFAFLDTGAMYRAATLGVLNASINLDDENAVAECVLALEIRMCRDNQEDLRIFLAGEDVTKRIRDEDVTASAKYIARNARVRERMVDLQRTFAGTTDLVTEGRDQGTVAFPDAPVKFFLDAGLEERVRRRKRDLDQQGEQVDEARLQENISSRDRSDRERAAGPLTKSSDMVYIDTSQLDVSTAVSLMLAFAKKAINKE